MHTVKSLVHGKGEEYEHLQLKRQTEGFENGAKTAENQIAAYLEDFKKFISEDEKLLAEAQAAYNNHTDIATGDECKKSMAEARAYLDKAQGHLDAIKAAATNRHESIQSLHETATKAKAEIDLIRKEEPATKEDRGKRVEAAEALCKNAQSASETAKELLALAKQKALVERPLFLNALKDHSPEEDNMYYHLRDAKAIQEQVVAPRLALEQAANVKTQTEARKAHWATDPTDITKCRIDDIIRSIGIKCSTISQDEKAQRITDISHSMAETDSSLFPLATPLTTEEKTSRILSISARFSFLAMAEVQEAIRQQNLAAQSVGNVVIAPLQQAQANAAINAAAAVNNPANPNPGAAPTI